MADRYRGDLTDLRPVLSLKDTDEHAPVIARMGWFNDFVPESYLPILNADDCSTFRKYTP